MGKLKVLKGAAKLVDDVPGLLPRVTAGTREGNALPTGASIEDTVADFDFIGHIQAKAQKEGVEATQAEIAVLEAAEQASRREKSLFDKTAEPNPYYQTNSPAEYKRRYQQQLTNPDYMAVSSNPLNMGVDSGIIAKNQGRHIKERNDLMFRLGKNPRWKERYQEWVGDSAYDGEIMWHIDRQTDPTRPDSFIQFESPREGGLHAGTTRASEGVIGFGGDIDRASEIGEEIANRIDELAGALQMPERELHAVIGREIEAHFVKKFQEGQAYTGINTEDWQAIVDSLASGTVFEARELTRANGLIRALKDSPMPSSTPMLFRGQNGLLLEDFGGFSRDAIANQLRSIFPEDTKLIDIATSAPNTQAQKNLQEFIESKGYDHIVYHNSVEDKGSLSIINWNPDLQRSIYDPELAGVNPAGQGRAAAQGQAAQLGVAKEKPPAVDHRMADDIAFNKKRRQLRMEDPDMTNDEIRSVAADHVKRRQANREIMAEYPDGVNDLYLSSTLHGTKKGKQRVEMLKNPTEPEFKRWAAKHDWIDDTDGQYARVITDVEGNYYIWDSEAALHDDIIQKTGMKYDFEADWTDSDGMLVHEIFGLLADDKNVRLK